MTHVLVVDDDPAARTLLNLLLCRYEFTVTEADSGATALNWLDTYPDRCPDLVILDLWMPHMSGIVFLDKLRQRCTLPVLVMSANLGLMREAPRYPQLACLEKPFRSEQLLRQIRQLLNPGVLV